jgi:hypothetical protein
MPYGTNKESTMSYEYDSKVNRELAKTAISIYTKSHGISQKNNLTESAELLNEKELTGNIANLLVEYVSDTILIAEDAMRRRLSDKEIQAFSGYITENVNSLSEKGRVQLIAELAQKYTP